MKTAQGYPAMARVRVFSLTENTEQTKYFETYEQALSFVKKVNRISTLVTDSIAIVEVRP